MVNIGSKNGNWKNGICYERGYKLIRVYDHPYATKRGYIREHRYVMEKHLGRYLTKNEAIHHINGNRSDNRIENLQLLTHSKHSTITNNERIYKRKDHSNTICLLCNSKETYANKKTNYPYWHRFKDNYICNRCNNNGKQFKPKRQPKPKKIIIKKTINRICLNCNSDKTFMRKDGKQPIWYKYKDGFLCVKCNGYKRNKNKNKLKK